MCSSSARVSSPWHMTVGNVYSVRNKFDGFDPAMCSCCKTQGHWLAPAVHGQCCWGTANTQVASHGRFVPPRAGLASTDGTKDGPGAVTNMELYAFRVVWFILTPVQEGKINPPNSLHIFVHMPKGTKQSYVQHIQGLKVTAKRIYVKKDIFFSYYLQFGDRTMLGEGTHVIPFPQHVQFSLGPIRKLILSARRLQANMCDKSPRKHNSGQLTKHRASPIMFIEPAFGLSLSESSALCSITP